MPVDLVRALQLLQSLPPLLLSLIIFVGGFLIMFVAGRFFGRSGLYVYICITTIICNIQVLKVVDFGVFPEPIALGTVLFMSLFLCSDLVNEVYGKKAAQQGVYLGLGGYFFFALMMFLTLGYKPLPETHPLGGSHYDMQRLFLPSPGIFLASMVAYGASLLMDIFLYQKIRQRTHGKYLWLRVLVTTPIGIVVDNTVFSVLAWIVFNPTPFSFQTVLMTHILGGSVLRMILSIGYVPLMYIAKKYVTPEEKGV